MPFVETAYLDQRGSKIPDGSSGENVIHFAGVRMRVVGTGELDMTLYSLDDVRSTTLKTVPMSATEEFQKTRICSLTTQRAKLRISTDVKNEYFSISRIIIYTKPVYISIPG